MKTPVVVLPRMKRTGSDGSRIQAHHRVTDLTFVAGPDVHPAAVVYVHGGQAKNGSDFRVLSGTQCTMLPADRTTSLTLPTTPYWRVEVQQPTETETNYTVVATIDRDEQPQTPEHLRQSGPEARFGSQEVPAVADRVSIMVRQSTLVPPAGVKWLARRAIRRPSAHG